MTLATINYSTTDWDDKIKIVVRGDCPTIIILESAESALEINRVLTIAYFEDHEGQMTLDIDGSEYTFSQRFIVASSTERLPGTGPVADSGRPLLHHDPGRSGGRSN